MALTFAAGMASAEAKLLDWTDLDGWAADDHDAARVAFQETCGDLKIGDWPVLCAMAAKEGASRTFFETFFRPVEISDGSEALFTGYYEPELEGSRVEAGAFKYPLYRRPSDAPKGQPWLTREEIETSGVLEGRGLELVWLSDPVDKFFLQVQGSGRIKLSDGSRLRVGYGGKNGHPYKSIGNELVRRGIFEAHQVSAQTIRRWVQRNPKEGPKLLWHNPSYVFFREVTRVPANKGPLGAMNRSVTAGRTLAIDPEFVPLGAPVWLEKDGDLPIRRLMVAQDTGSAIKGAQRADIFFGSGKEAGNIAGRTRDTGRMVVLLPVEQAMDLVESR
ncbi:MAG: MltA domain-containing protein [Boseongicola sp.]|nr:MltA domain-containing protein [Boseongicola sp.]MDD9979384.1 MltA domain-containing protein [Boseongicola sp.]